LSQDDAQPTNIASVSASEQAQHRTDLGIENQTLAQRKEELIANEKAILTQIASAASSSGQH
jgi:hypothetical protein